MNFFFGSLSCKIKKKYVGFCSFSEMKNEKDTRFFAFSPKASKSRFEQAGLLTYPLCNTFPPDQIQTVVHGYKVLPELQQRELCRNYRK